MSWKKRILWILGGVVLLIIVIAVAVSVLRPRFAYLRQGSLKETADYEGTQYARAPMAAVSMEKRSAYGPGQVAIPKERKLIKKAELNLEVVNCDDAARKIAEIVSNYSGIIVDSNVEKYQNEAKKGTTVLKVEPKNFDEILAKIKSLGKLDSQRITGEDVTEEYVDLEARLKNFQMVKERLTAILQDKARTVKDILEVERELARVGEQIESIQGRMKYLDRQVELATITVNYYEAKAITPEPINILKKLKDTIRAAVEAFINVFNATIIVIFALLPIFIWLGIIIFLVSLIRKLFFRRK